MCQITLKLGNCLDLLKTVKDKSVQQIFADLPYNLSGDNFKTTQSGRRVACNKGKWDIVENFADFNIAWIRECARVLTDNGTIWISDTLRIITH